MNIPPEELAAQFHIPKGSIVGIEISVDLGGKPAGLDEPLGYLARLRQARAHVAAVGEFRHGNEDSGALSGRAHQSAEELARASKDPDSVDLNGRSNNSDTTPGYSRNSPSSIGMGDGSRSSAAIARTPPASGSSSAVRPSRWCYRCSARHRPDPEGTWSRILPRAVR